MSKHRSHRRLDGLVLAAWLGLKSFREKVRHWSGLRLVAAQPLAMLPPAEGLVCCIRLNLTEPVQRSLYVNVQVLEQNIERLVLRSLQERFNLLEHMRISSSNSGTSLKASLVVDRYGCQFSPRSSQPDTPVPAYFSPPSGDW